MNLSKLYSRDNSVSCDLMPLGTSYLLQDVWPGGSPANAFSNLAWHGGAIGSNAYTILGWFNYVDGGLNQDGTYFGFKNTNDYSVGANKYLIPTNDGFGLPITNRLANDTLSTNISVIQNFGSISATWNMLGVQQNGSTMSIINNGRIVSSVLGAPPSAGITRLGVPYFSLSGTSGNGDWYYNGNTNPGSLWPQVSFGMLALWNRVLSQQEILDFYGMTRYGCGYTISRNALDLLIYARRDSTVSANITTMPAYSAFDSARLAVPDLSGQGNNMNLYTQAAAWSNLLGTCPIYVPSTWFDMNLAYNQRKLVINGSGSTIS